jgi:hypothetical protein
VEVNASKYQMLYNSLEFAIKKGVEAFNLLFEHLNFSPSTLLPFHPSFLDPPAKAFD